MVFENSPSQKKSMHPIAKLLQLDCHCFATSIGETMRISAINVLNITGCWMPQVYVYH